MKVISNYWNIKLFLFLFISDSIFFIAVILNEHLTEALRRMREESSENNVDKLVHS